VNVGSLCYMRLSIAVILAGALIVTKRLVTVRGRLRLLGVLTLRDTVCSPKTSIIPLPWVAACHSFEIPRILRLLGVVPIRQATTNLDIICRMKITMEMCEHATDELEMCSHTYYNRMTSVAFDASLHPIPPSSIERLSRDPTSSGGLADIWKCLWTTEHLEVHIMLSANFLD
jgi:hypothetical protein